MTDPFETMRQEMAKSEREVRSSRAKAAWRRRMNSMKANEDDHEVKLIRRGDEIGIIDETGSSYSFKEVLLLLQTAENDLRIVSDDVKGMSLDPAEVDALLAHVDLVQEQAKALKRLLKGQLRGGSFPTEA